MSTSYVMKVSGNGQVSVPAEVRARWKTNQLLVVDLGSRVVMRPLPPDPVGALRGKYAGGPTTEQLRAAERAADESRERQPR